jgi:uncharacterized protein DUF4123
MNGELRERVLQTLWPQGARLSTWAILDCARDPRIYLALIESRLEFRCLYSGRLPRALEMVAPHLVELLPTNRLTQRLLDDGWGRSWGVLMQVDDASDLRHHLRKFLKVQDEAGRRLLFRYYDPRVLRAYLPTCRGEELRQVFGPVQRFLAENDDGQALLAWRCDGQRLVVEQVGPC